MRGAANHLRLFIVMAIIAFVIILIFGCPRNSLLTNAELKSLISEKGISPILTNDIGLSYTVILYKDVKSNEMLELIAYKDRWNKIKTKQYAFYESRRINKVDVEYWSVEPYSYSLIGYVGINILNKDIFDEARSAEVVLDNGLVIRARFQDSNILLIQAKRNFLWEKPKLKKVEIYDDKGNVIHGFY